jgi:hypothetical protein
MSAIFVELLCILPLAVCSEPKDWAFMQSVGGIALGTASVSEEKWSLAVRANVSGLEEITVKPTLLNSGLICESTTASVQGNTIYLTINSGLVRDGYSASCPAANLGRVKEGSYQVFYKSPNGESQKLGEIVLGSNPALKQDAPALHVSQVGYAPRTIFQVQ